MQPSVVVAPVAGEKREITSEPSAAAGGEHVPAAVPVDHAAAVEREEIAALDKPSVQKVVEKASVSMFTKPVDKPSCALPTIPEEDTHSVKEPDEAAQQPTNEHVEQPRTQEESLDTVEQGPGQNELMECPGSQELAIEGNREPAEALEATETENTGDKKIVETSQKFVVPDVGIVRRGEIVAELKRLVKSDSSILESAESLLKDEAQQLQLSSLVCEAVEHTSASIVMSLAHLGIWCIDENEERLAETLLRVADHLGSASAQNALGHLHSKNGRAEESASAFRRAAAQGHGGAALKLASAATDDEVAFTYMLQAAEAGEVEAMAAVAAFLAQGKGTPRDVSKSVQWTHRAAQAGHALSQLQFSVMTSATHPQMSFEWAMKAAQQGVRAAEYQVARAYMTGQGVQADGGKCLEYLRRASEHGLVDAIYLLGGIYLEGLADLNVSPDHKKAVEYLRQAVEMGHLEAMHVLGALHLIGQGGVEKDVSKTVELWQKAAHLGHAKSQFELGRFYISGEFLPVDEKKGFLLMLMAARAGLPSAAFAVGIAYVKGSGAEVNMLAACHWMEQSLLGGHAQAREVFVSLMQDKQLRSAYMQWKEERKLIEISAPSSRVNLLKMLS